MRTAQKKITIKFWKMKAVSKKKIAHFHNTHGDFSWIVFSFYSYFLVGETRSCNANRVIDIVHI